MGDGYQTPDFARVEIKLTGKCGLRRAADALRDLAVELEKVAEGDLPDPTSNFLAWGSIKAASHKLRSA